MPTEAELIAKMTENTQRQLQTLQTNRSVAAKVLAAAKHPDTRAHYEEVLKGLEHGIARTADELEALAEAAKAAAKEPAP